MTAHERSTIPWTWEYWTPRTAGFWLAIVALLWSVPTILNGLVDVDGEPIDYLAFWGAGELVLNGEVADVYNPVVHHAATEEFTGARDIYFLPYLYPPPFLFLAAALRWLGYYFGLAVFTVAGVGLFVRSALRIQPSPYVAAAAVLFPTALWNLQLGQVGYFVGAGVAMSTLEHRDRPMIGGLGLAILSFKPQFGILVGIYLVVSRSWKALGVGTGISGLLVAASVVVFGAERWSEFFNSSSDVGELMDLFAGRFAWPSQSIFGLARGFGLSEGTAAALHVAFVVIFVFLLRMVWRNHRNGRGLEALVMLGTVLVSPRILPYDLQILGLVAVLLSCNRSSDKTAQLLFVAGGLTILMATQLPGGLAAALLMVWMAVRSGNGSTAETTDTVQPIMT